MTHTRTRSSANAADHRGIFTVTQTPGETHGLVRPHHISNSGAAG